MICWFIWKNDQREWTLLKVDWLIDKNDDTCFVQTVMYWYNDESKFLFGEFVIEYNILNAKFCTQKLF